MKKHLLFITKDTGFILLHVLFVISLLFILISSGIASYRNEIYITNRQIEQIKIETLFQMAQEKYKRELRNTDEVIDSVSYEFPEGEVDISVLSIEDTYLKLSFVIKFHGNRDNFIPLNHLLVYE